MSSSGKLRSASMRLHAALAALPSAGFAAACVFGAATSMADTAVTTGLNAFSTESTLDLGALARDTGGIALFSGNGTIAASIAISNGLVGPWAIVQKGGASANNTASGFTFATLSGSTVTPYLGATAMAGTGAWGGIPSGGDGTINYDVSGTMAVTGLSRSINTLRYTGGAAATQVGNISTAGDLLTTNGFMNAGGGEFIIGGTGSANNYGINVTVGAARDLVLAPVSANITLRNAIKNNAAGASAVTIFGTAGKTVTLAGVSAYTGQTTVAGGNLIVSGTGSINTSGGITVAGADAKYIHTSSVASSRTITLTRGTVDGTGSLGTVNVADTSAAVLSNGNGGTGALTLGALNFAGDATLNLNYLSGTRPLNVTGSLVTTPANGVVTVNVASSGWTTGAHNLVGFGGFSGSLSDFALGTVSGLNSRQTIGALGLTSSNLTLQINGDSPRWTGAQSSAWTTDTIGGARNWRLVTAGTATEFIAGDEVLFDDSATGSTAVSISSANVSPASTTFNNSTKNYTVSSSGGFGIASGSLTKSGTGTVVLSTANTYTGSTTINAGVLQLGDGATDGSIANSATIANNGTLAYNLVGNHTYANAITGTGTVTKTGAGVLTLTGANTYTGGTTVNGGKLVATVNGLNGGPISLASGATITFTGNNQISTSSVSGAGAILNDSANTIIFSGDHSGFTGSFTHSATNNNTQFSSALSGSANASYTLSAGELIFAANGDYTVKFGALSSVAGNIRGGNTATGNTTLEVGALGTNTSIAGNLNNGTTKVLALAKVGSGVLTLSGNNSYGGGTTVNAGTLSITGALTSAANAVIVASGGTLGGNGTIAGPVAVSGSLAPGASLGVLTASGALTLNSGSTTRLEINGLVRGTEHDGVNIAGAFTQGGTLQLAFGSAIAAGNYTLFQINGTSSGAFAAVTAASSATPTPVSLTNSGGVWTGTIDGSSLSFNPTTGVLTTTAGATHTALQTWRFDQFGVYDDTGAVLAGDTEDYDGDGLANLLEYALGSDPKVAGASPITVARSGNVLTLTYTRRSPADAGLTYTVQGSADLSSGFSNATGSTNTVGATSTYTDNVDLSAAGVRRFLRLSISYTAP